jgi:hypothetical protein
MIDEYDGYQCYRLKTTGAVQIIETSLGAVGRSFKTKISNTKKRGREFIVLLLDK